MFPTFALGGREVRTSVIANALGEAVRHTLITLDGRRDATALLSPELGAKVLDGPSGRSSRETMRFVSATIHESKPDVVATYNWGAIEAVGAALWHRCPVVHTEDGFGADEPHGPLWRRRFIRRLLLRHATTTIVPSRTLMKIANDAFGLPPAKVRYLPNGVNTQRFAPGRRESARRELGLPPGGLVIGAVGRLSAEKAIPDLIRAFADAVKPPAILVVVGEGPERDRCVATASALGVSDRVVFAGRQRDAASWFAALDVFAMSSVTEQMPMSLLEAMATGLPVVATAVGDTREMLPDAQREFLAAPGDVAGLSRLLSILAHDAESRHRLGTMNRAHCSAEYSESSMVSAYAAEWFGAAGRPVPPLGSCA